MANLTFNYVGISAIAGAIPKNTIKNMTFLPELYTQEERQEIVDKTGIIERRHALLGQCASDFCYAAANQLIERYSIDRTEIELLIFVSQTPDYRMPATSIILQHKLGLNKSAAAFDISLGCSGFVYALSVAFSMLQSGTIKKALLLDGETRSRVYSAKDRKTGFLFGDGGVAALLEYDPLRFKSSYFSLNSDGSREDLIKMDAGGYRIPSSIETLTEKVVDEHGNIRSMEHGYMNGADVFNFVLQEIPKDINSILNTANLDKSDIDYFLFHQANDYMNSYLIKKFGLDKAKVPSSIAKFGNTSSVSIPLTLVSELDNTQLQGEKKMLLCGFGVGMSWASAVMQTNNLFNAGLIEI
jgi:3-oxoacyl-[acyl-carrier-protein] synthase-3